MVIAPCPARGDAVPLTAEEVDADHDAVVEHLSLTVQTLIAGYSRKWSG
jgi:hypothetical protein